MLFERSLVLFLFLVRHLSNSIWNTLNFRSKIQLDLPVVSYSPGADASGVDWEFVPVDVVDLLEYVVHVPHLHRPIYR